MNVWCDYGGHMNCACGCQFWDDDCCLEQLKCMLMIYLYVMSSKFLWDLLGSNGSKLARP